MKILKSIVVLLSLASCSGLGSTAKLPADVQCLSLTGTELRPAELSDERYASLLDNLLAAETELVQDPRDEMAAIWVGRRLGYLGRYREAITIYGDALEFHPESYRLRRHRGHRYISLRRFPDAIEDLGQAARLADGVPDSYEQDGAPNEFDIPRSTTQSNIFYHLALAQYLDGDFARSLESWRRCLYFSEVNDDMFVAAAYWNVLTLWRLSMDAEARLLLDEIRPEMDVIENHDYHRLLLLFKGDLPAEQVETVFDATAPSPATVGYGLGMWHWKNGRTERAFQIWQRVVDETYWPAFGHIAAEVEIAGR